MSSSDSPSNLAQGQPADDGKPGQENAKSSHSSSSGHKLRFSGLNKGHRTDDKGLQKQYKKQQKPSPTTHQKSKVTQSRRDTLKALAKQPPRLKESNKTSTELPSQASDSTITSSSEEKPQTTPQIQSGNGTTSKSRAESTRQQSPTRRKSSGDNVVNETTNSTSAGSDLSSAIPSAASGASVLDSPGKHQRMHDHQAPAETTSHAGKTVDLSSWGSGTSSPRTDSPTRSQKKKRKNEDASPHSRKIPKTGSSQKDFGSPQQFGDTKSTTEHFSWTGADTVAQQSSAEQKSKPKQRKKKNSGQTSKADTPGIFSHHTSPSSVETYSGDIDSNDTSTVASQARTTTVEQVTHLPSVESSNVRTSASKRRKKRGREQEEATTTSGSTAVEVHVPERNQGMSSSIPRDDVKASPKKSRKAVNKEIPESNSAVQVQSTNETKSSSDGQSHGSSATSTAARGSSTSKVSEQHSHHHQQESLQADIRSFSLEIVPEAQEDLRKFAGDLWSSYTVCGQLFGWAIFALLKECSAPQEVKGKKKKKKYGQTIRKIEDVRQAVDILDIIKEAERRLYGTQGVFTESGEQKSEPKKKRVRFCTYDFTTVDACPSDVGSEYWMKAIVQREREKQSEEAGEFALLPCLAKPTKKDEDDCPEISTDLDTNIPIRTPMEVLLEYLRKIGKQVIRLADLGGYSGSGQFFLCFFQALRQIAGLNRNKMEDVNALQVEKKRVCSDIVLKKAAEQYIYEFQGLKRFLNGEDSREISKIVPFKFQISACLSSVMRFHMRRVFNPHAEFIVDDDDDGEKSDDTGSETGSTFSFTSSACGVGRGGGADVKGFISIDEECQTLKYNIDDLAAVVNRAMWTVCEYSNSAASVLEAATSKSGNLADEELHKAVTESAVSNIFEVLEYAQSAMFVKQLFAHPAVKAAANTETSSWERLRTLAECIEELGSESENYLLPFKNLDEFVQGLPSEDTLASLLQSAEKVRKKHLRSLNQLKKKLRRRSRREGRGKGSEDSRGSSSEESTNTGELTSHQRALLDNEDLLSLESLFQYPSLVYVSPSLSTGEEIETEQIFDSPALDPDEKVENHTSSTDADDTVQVDSSSVAELTSEAFGFAQQFHENLSEPEGETVQSPTFAGTLPLDDTPVKNSQNPYWNL